MVRAFFPGSFDPIHYGHIDIAERAVRLFDELIIAVYDKPLKNLLFPPEKRIALAEEAFAGNPKIRVTGYNNLTVDACREADAQVIVRGLRVFSDFEFEFQMALMNRKLAREAETVFLMPALSWVYLSSSIVKDVAAHGGEVEGLVPPPVKEALSNKYDKAP